MRWFCLTALLALVAGCGGDNRPGWTSSWPEAETRNFYGVTMPGRIIQQPLTLFLKRDRALIFHAASGSGEPATLQIDGTEPARITINPGAPQRFVLRTTNNQITIAPENGPLWMSVPYIGPAPAHQRANILLISIDTLRADYFTPEHMPRLYELFAKGFLFDDVTSSSPWTLPAHASMFTSLYPNVHGVRTPDDKLSNEVETMAEALRELGYYNLAYTEGNYLSASFGLNQGFHRYVDNPPDMMAATPEAASKLAANIDSLRAEIDAMPDMPLFALLHTYEVHCPYLPHGNLEDPNGVGLTQWLLDNEHKPAQDAALPLLRDLYAAEVDYTDRLLAPFVESLLEKGDWLVVLTSDHGEEFGEHGGLLHADTLYEEAVRVPLAMVGSGIGLPHRFEDPVSLVDIPSTIFAQLKLEAPATWQGRDAIRAREKRPVYSESFFFGVHIPSENPRAASVRAGNEKLIQVRNFGDIHAELYHLNDDPNENRNVQAEAVKQRDALFLYLDAYLRNKGFSPDKVEGLTEEQKELMRSLGYMQ